MEPIPAPPLRAVIDGVMNAKRANITRGIRAAETRPNDFANELQRTLTGVALEYTSREHAEGLLDQYWTDNRSATYIGATSAVASVREVIIGSGYHAAVYAATRVLAGKPRPLVLERSNRVGGVFATHANPSFYLNSRNRPGGLGQPGELDGSLNYIPGAPIQPAHISGREYQTNADMALAIRFTLAQYADVIPGITVTGYERNSLIVTGEGLTNATLNGSILAARVIDARGLGDPNAADKADGVKVMTFPQFAYHMAANPWPRRGLNRVAVIGDGDSARTAVEALLGIGPETPMGAAALDFVQRVDWYALTLPATCERWRGTQRSRYQAIGNFLRADKLGAVRLRIINSDANFVATPIGAIVEGRVYDMAIAATGSTSTVIPGTGRGELYDGGSGQPLARSIVPGRVLSIGPLANLPYSTQETRDNIPAIAANKTAMWRLGPRTTQLAATLPDPVPVSVPGPFPPPTSRERLIVPAPTAIFATKGE